MLFHSSSFHLMYLLAALATVMKIMFKCLMDQILGQNFLVSLLCFPVASVFP